MRCKICGNPTNKFFSSFHTECVQRLKDQWYLMGKAIDEYNTGAINRTVATYNLIEAATEYNMQRYFRNNLFSNHTIKAQDALLFSQNMIMVAEEKNRCHMQRTGLSYAKYPQWENGYQNICNCGWIAITDAGIYLSDDKHKFISYSKIIDVNLSRSFLTGKEVCIEIQSSSVNRHRFLLWANDKNDENFAICVYDIVRFMLGHKSAETKNHLIKTPPGQLDLIFKAHPINSTISPINPYNKIAETPVFTEKTASFVSVPSKQTSLRHSWTFDEDKFCCKKYFEQFVINKSSISLNQFVQELKKEFPTISPASLQMKTQNIKYLCIKHNVTDNLSAKPLSQYSKQNERAFFEAMKDFNL